jgi:NADH:ubiquinone oxidoreductase subunit E
LESTKCSVCGHAVDRDFGTAIRKFSRDRGNLIPILHAVQDTIGFLPDEAVKEIADWLSIPASEVYGTATFYTLFAMEQKGEHVVRLCDSPPCHIEGSDAVRKALEQHLGVKDGETTQDGLFTFEIVSCFGLCGVAPAMMVDEDVYGNLTPEMIGDILGKYSKEGA